MSSYEMGYLTGQAVGCIFILLLFYALIDSLVCRRMFDDPVAGKLTAVAAAWGLLLLLYVIPGSSVGRFGGRFITSIVAAAVVGLYAYRRGNRVRRQAASQLDRTFD